MKWSSVPLVTLLWSCKPSNIWATLLINADYFLSFIRAKRREKREVRKDANATRTQHFTPIRFSREHIYSIYVSVLMATHHGLFRNVRFCIRRAEGLFMLGDDCLFSIRLAIRKSGGVAARCFHLAELAEDSPLSCLRKTTLFIPRGINYGMLWLLSFLNPERTKVTPLQRLFWREGNRSRIET